MDNATGQYIPGTPVTPTGTDPAGTSASVPTPAVTPAGQGQSKLQAQPDTPTVPKDTANPNTGDNVADVALRALAQAHGISEASYQVAIAPAMASGDVSKLDFAKIPATAISAVIALVQSRQGAVAAAQEQSVKLVHEVAGNPDNWKAAVAYVNTAMPEAVKAALEAHLNSGNPELVKYAAAQIMQAAQAGGVVNASPAQFGLGAQNLKQGLSATEFAQKYADLKKAAGNRSMNTGPLRAQYDALLEQRRVGKLAGLE